MAEDYGLWRYNTTPEEFKAQMPEYLAARGLSPDMETIFDLNDDIVHKLTRVYFTDGVSYAFNTFPPLHLTLMSEDIKAVNMLGEITEIANRCFYGMRNLATVNLPDTVTSIGSEAFMYDSGLTSVNIPESVTSIGASAFTRCTKLSDIKIPSGVTSIPNYCFAQASVDNIELPSDLTRLGEYAFSGLTVNDGILSIPSGVTEIPKGCLKGVKTKGIEIWGENVTLWSADGTSPYKDVGYFLINRPTPPASYTSYQEIIDAGVDVYVPDESVDIYKSNSTWSAIANKIWPISMKGQPLPDREPIGYKATITLDNGEVVQPLAYTRSETLTNDDVPSNAVSIVLTENTTSIEGVNDKYKLRTLSLGTNCKYIVDSFSYCPLLALQDINWGVIRGIEYSFKGYGSEHEVIPSNTVSTGLTLPNTIRKIGEYCFNQYKRLSEVTINSDDMDIITIGFGSFAGGGALSKLTVGGRFRGYDKYHAFSEGTFSIYVPEVNREFFTYDMYWSNNNDKSRLRYY